MIWKALILVSGSESPVRYDLDSPDKLAWPKH